MSTFNPDNKMLQQYLQKKLSPENEERVELWLAEHPEILESLELDIMLQDGLEHMQQSTAVKDNEKKPFDWLSLFRKPVYAPLLILASVLSYYVGKSNLFGQSTNPMHNTPIVFVSQTRGSDGVSATFNQQEGYVMAVLELSQVEEKTYQVNLTSNNTLIQEIKNLELLNYNFNGDGNGDLNVHLAVSKIPKGTAQLTVYEQNTAQQIAQFSIQID